MPLYAENKALFWGRGGVVHVAASRKILFGGVDVVLHLTRLIVSQKRA